MKSISANKHDSHIFKFDRRNLDLRLRITMDKLEGKIPKIHGVIYKELHVDKVDSVFYEQDHSYKLIGEPGIRYIYVHIVFEEEAKVKLLFLARTRPSKDIKSKKTHFVDLPESMSMQQCQTKLLNFIKQTTFDLDSMQADIKENLKDWDKSQSARKGVIRKKNKRAVSAYRSRKETRLLT